MPELVQYLLVHLPYNYVCQFSMIVYSISKNYLICMSRTMYIDILQNYLNVFKIRNETLKSWNLMVGKSVYLCNKKLNSSFDVEWKLIT